MQNAAMLIRQQWNHKANFQSIPSIKLIGHFRTLNNLTLVLRPPPQKKKKKKKIGQTSEYRAILFTCAASVCFEELK